MKTNFQTLTKKYFDNEKEIPSKVIVRRGEEEMSVDIYPLNYAKNGFSTSEELGINWSAIGTVSTSDTYMFTELLSEAIRVVDNYNLHLI